MDVFDDLGNLCSDRFEPDAFDRLVAAVQRAGTMESRSLRCKAGHVILALWPTLSSDVAWHGAIAGALGAGCSLAAVPDLIAALVKDTDHEQSFELRKADFDSHLLHALESCGHIENEFGDTIWDAGDKPIGILPLWIAALRGVAPEHEEQLKGILDLGAAIAALCMLPPIGSVGEAHEDLPEEEWFDGQGMLDLALFDSMAVRVLEATRDKAGSMGYNRLLPCHLYLALLEEPEGSAGRGIRVQSVNSGPREVADHIRRMLDLGPGVRPTVPVLRRDMMSASLHDALREAFVVSGSGTRSPVGEPALLVAVLRQEEEGMIGRWLSGAPLGLSVSGLIREAQKRLREGGLDADRPFMPPAELAGMEDLTYQARQKRIVASTGQDQLIKDVLRGLHKRQDNCVLITGEAGVGKSTLVRELARRIAAGEVPFLKRKKLLYFDSDGIALEQSRERLESLLATVKGRSDLIICIDHFEGVVRYAGQRESDNRAILRVATMSQSVQIVAVIENRHFSELMSTDYTLLDHFMRVDVPEVKPDVALQILERTVGPEFERAYGLAIEPNALKRAVFATHEFVMSERLPSKAIKALRAACELVYFRCEVDGGEERAVTDASVVSAVSERTGVDESTIAGTGSEVDFQEVLSRFVVGQDDAVTAVARRLKRIKSGDVDDGKPAAVFLFAGLTGTGKTELAKAIARIYSASGKLIVYSMTRFSEEHSVSGIQGVPPGYVGHESGGRLINDLNADPFGVVLFDEAEKADPTVWQAMLPLFDEAWIEDQRNVRAYGNRAIFILTSNAGQELIRSDAGRSDLEEIKERVARSLIDYRNPRNGKQPFSPEFLGRITDVLIFNPLSSEAIHAITRMHIGKLVAQWKTKRDKDLIVHEDVANFVAEICSRKNSAAAGGTGGRIVAQQVGNLIGLKAIDLIASYPEQYRAARGVRITLAGGDTIHPELILNGTRSAPEACNGATSALKRIPPLPVEMIAEQRWCLVEELVEGWAGNVSEFLSEREIARVRGELNGLRRELMMHVAHAGRAFDKAIERVQDLVQEAATEPEEPRGDSA